MRFLLFFSFLFLIELYVFFGLRNAIPSGWPYKLGLTLNLISIALVLVGFLRVYAVFDNGYSISDLTTNVLMGLTVTIYITKLVFALFLLFGDVVRLFETIGSWIGSLNSGESMEIPSRRKFIAQAGLITAAIPFSAFLFGITKGKYRYKIRRETLVFDHLPSAFDGFKIVQISDIHAGSFDDKIRVMEGIQKIQNEQADIILFTGDLVNNLAKEIEPYMDMFASLKAPFGKFSVLGNHDYGEYVRWNSEYAKQKNLETLKTHHQEMGFRLLNNESVELTKDNQSIQLGGVENWGLPPFPSRGDLETTFSEDSNDFRILMSHDPHHWDQKVLSFQKHVALTLSGHTHGMQMGVEIPGIKWSPVKYRYPRWAGLYEEAGKYLYVNRGFGFIGFPGRVGMWPEITVLELTSAQA